MPAPTDTTPQQPSLFSARQTRRLWLERLVIPRFVRAADGRTARTNAMKHLLRVIESHSPSGDTVRLRLTTIAHEMGVDERTASRHVADAVQVGLLQVSKTEGLASSYAVQWDQVAQIILDNPKTTGLIDPHHQETKTSDKKSDNQTDNSKTSAKKSANSDLDKSSDTPVNLAGTPVNLTPTPVNLARKANSHTSSSRARVLNHVLNHENIPSWGNDGMDDGNEDTDRHHARSGSRTGSRPRNTSANGFAGWPKLITLDDLRTVRKTLSLWEHAVTVGWVPESDLNKLRFFTLAKYVTGQAAAGKVSNPGGYFTRQLSVSVSTGCWLGSNADEQAAAAAIQRLPHLLQQVQSAN